MPRNWMVDDAGAIRLIDFGHTREDFWILDVDKLWSDQWAVLEASSALGAVSTIVWSREHGDRGDEAFGRRHLARLRQRRRP